MANKEHLAILRQGVEVWNEWRNKNLNVKLDFKGADIRELDLRKANLSMADLRYANLMYANLYEVNLSQSDLRQVSLFRANLKKADFSAANLSKLDLRFANFNEANLNRANLNEINLSEANLNQTQALGTNFSGANLTGICIEDWHINTVTNLTDVICDYIYLQQSQQERRPSSGNFAPSEFTKLFQKSLETVDIIFRNGINWDAFAYSFKKLEVENQGAQLDVQSIEKKGDGILVVRVAVALDADKAKIHSEFIQGYEFATKALSAQYQARLEDKDTLIFKQETQINRLFDIVEQQGSVQKALAENPRKVSNYDQRYSQFAGGNVDANTVDADQIGGNIQNNDA